MKTFRDLLIWQKAMKLVTLCYEVSKKFPKEEQYGLTNQIRRCSVSIPSNISEGYGRGSGNEFNRFLKIALGSLFEFQTQIEIALNLKYISSEEYNIIYEDSRELERMLTAFIKTLNLTS